MATISINADWDEVVGVLSGEGANITTSSNPDDVWQEAGKWNIFAKYKPVKYAQLFCQDYDSGDESYNSLWWRGNDGNCGINIPIFTGEEIFDYEDPSKEWTHDYPTGWPDSPFRKTDACKYNSDAPNIINSFRMNVGAGTIYPKTPWNFQLKFTSTPTYAVGLNDIEASIGELKYMYPGIIIKYKNNLGDVDYLYKSVSSQAENYSSDEYLITHEEFGEIVFANGQFPGTSTVYAVLFKTEVPNIIDSYNGFYVALPQKPISFEIETLAGDVSASIDKIVVNNRDLNMGTCSLTIDFTINNESSSNYIFGSPKTTNDGYISWVMRISVDGQSTTEVDVSNITYGSEISDTVYAGDSNSYQQTFDLSWGGITIPEGYIISDFNRLSVQMIPYSGDQQLESVTKYVDL